jgi:tRNA(Ile)-lysidine synthetase-like protein
MQNICYQIYHDWFQNSDKWFIKENAFDIFLSEKYISKIKDNSNYIRESIHTFDKTSLIGAVIAYDQIPRHHNRICNIDCQELSLIARDISLYLIDQINNNEYLFDSITPHEWCFIFLPFRHVKDLQKTNYIINFILCKHNNEFVSVKDRSIYKRFLFHCIRDVYQVNTLRFLKLQQVVQDTIFIDNWKQFSEILEHMPVGKIERIQNNVVSEFQNEVNCIDKTTLIIVSISGGVDSMISLHLLTLFFPLSNIIAVHINYNNRKENKDEVSFVKQYCSLLGVKLYHRKIIELKRIDCRNNGLRDLYEISTKNIRFDMYKQVAELHKNNKYIVLLGHNKDDCFENIITNIGMKNNYNNLTGIEKLSEINDIHFWRPLLNIRKKDIIQYAKSSNIPFLHDSTPKWSKRGMIRDKVLPCLEDINDDMFNSFFELKNRLSENENLVQNFVIKNILKKFEYNDNTITAIFSYDEFFEDINIWSSIFRSQQFNFKISHKCLKEFVKYVERCKIKLENTNNMKFVLKNDIRVISYLLDDRMIKISFIKMK